MTRAQMGAMLPAPAPAPGGGQFSGHGAPVQDVTGAVVRELRTSMLDIATAVRLGARGKLTYFGTVLPPVQTFTSPSQSNDPDSVRASVAQAGVAPRALNKTSSSGPRIAQTLPGMGPALTQPRRGV